MQLLSNFKVREALRGQGSIDSDFKNGLINFQLGWLKRYEPNSFTISVYGSLCNYLFFDLIISSFLIYTSVSWYSILGLALNRKRKQRVSLRPEQRSLHVLMNTKMVRLASDVRKNFEAFSSV